MMLPEAAQRVRHLEGTLVATLHRWGYQEIIPPSFEYLDVLSVGLEADALDKLYTLVDRGSGRTLLLRPDATAQIARMVAMGLLGRHIPLRLCYRTTVFRYEPEHAGREREIFQVGAELIGADSVETDAEILGLLIDCLMHVGLSGFRISLGHVGFFKALLSKAGLSPEERKRVEHAAARKDLPQLQTLLREAGVAKHKAKAILEVPGLYGGDEVLERGGVIAGRDPGLRSALARLERVYRLLAMERRRDYLMLDLGEVRGFDYYDGVTFDVFTDGLGCELGGGGRYNHLIGRFGRNVPSTGFALDVDRLSRALEQRRSGQSWSQADVLLAAPARLAERSFDVARLLRDSGLRVVQHSIDQVNPATTNGILEEGARLLASAVIMLGVARVASDEALVLTDFLADGPRSRKHKPVRRTIKIKDLASTLRNH